MTTEVWFRNPDNYIRELVECGQGNIAWDRGLLVKKRLDPGKHADLYFGKAIPYRVLLVGDQGTAELRPGDTLEYPTAVYPTWVYGEDATLLEEVVAQPVGQDLSICSDFSVPSEDRPVLGQEHRVVVTSIPDTKTGPGKRFMRYLKELQEDYPNCIIHVHGLYGWKVAFGMSMRAADIDPRTPAQKGKVVVPAGREMKFEAVQAHPQWVTSMGFKPVDLAIPRNRCMYNIKSAIWAGKNYETLIKFKTQGESKAVDHTSSNAEFVPEETDRIFSKSVVKKQPGDQYHCDTCSLQLDCKYFRQGAVCSVPGAEPTDLARFFKTRDSDQIIDGLGTLMAAQTHRLQRGLVDEEEYGELDPEVTKIVANLFDQGVKLAKLVNPELRAGARVQVNVGAGGAAAVSLGSPRQMMSAIIREIESRGVPRDQITPEMVKGVLAGMANNQIQRDAIEGQVVEHNDEKSA